MRSSVGSFSGFRARGCRGFGNRRSFAGDRSCCSKNRDFMTALLTYLRYLSIPGSGFDAVGIQQLHLWDSSLGQNTLNVVLMYVSLNYSY